jgi:hypothetical protein
MVRGYWGTAFGFAGSGAGLWTEEGVYVLCTAPLTRQLHALTSAGAGASVGAGAGSNELNARKSPGPEQWSGGSGSQPSAGVGAGAGGVGVSSPYLSHMASAMSEDWGPALQALAYKYRCAFLSPYSLVIDLS